MRVLVTGGAGYIGSHAVRECIEQGHQVWVIDDLSKGHREAVDSRARFVQGSVGNYDLVSEILRANKIETVVHFAGFIEVAESVQYPEKYFANNVDNGRHLLRAMKDTGTKKLVFSSTAAVYGVPSVDQISEEQSLSPINPYGESKMKMEELVREAAKEFGLGFAILRYFNVAGAYPDGSLGEDHEPESHLIPRIIQSIVRGKNQVSIYGSSYPTRDGTCIRDYVHVVDLVKAHILAMSQIQVGRGDVFNLGSERGFTVREVVQACESVTGAKLEVKLEPPRSGDPATLVANSSKARNILKWNPKYSDLTTIVKHAWAWHSTHPMGYPKST